MATPAYPISKIDFPTFTICSRGMIDEVFKAGFIQQFKEYLQKEKNVTADIIPYKAAKYWAKILSVS